jgi:hypothetical protein
MKLSSRGARALAAVVLCGGVAAGVASAAVAPATAAPASGSVVLVNCLGKGQVRPGSYVLTCADGGDSLTGLHWVSWKGVAFGSGTEVINDCHPYCAAGKFYRFPVLITLWRAIARPGHGGQGYFSRLTIIHTGSLTFPYNRPLGRTVTWSLLPTAG